MHSAYASSVRCSRIQVFLLHHFGEVFNGTFHRPDFFLNSRLFFFWRLNLSCFLPTVLHLVDVIWTTIDITMAYEWSMSYEEQYHNNYRYHHCPGHWKMSAPKISAFEHMNQNVHVMFNIPCFDPCATCNAIFQDDFGELYTDWGEHLWRPHTVHWRR